MELSFNVEAGPLTQISVPIISLTSAVQLAVGSYGWWRARGRTKSLQGVLGSAGTSLVPVHSFNLPAYLDARKDCAVRGISIMKGEVFGANLPRSSTSKEGSAGQLCLRALITGLLCFYSGSAATRVLAELIPSSMIHREQEGEPWRFEGPILGSLKEYVEAVEIEEDSTLLKKKILQRLDAETSSLNIGSQAIRTDQGIRGSDHAKAKAFLKWMLTSMTKRDVQIYPTRSIFAWSIGMVMSQLGFQISASKTVITSSSQYSQYSARNSRGYVSDVVLVVDRAVLTDPMEADTPSWDPGPVHLSVKPRIVPIYVIPWIAFRQTAHELRLDIHHLIDVWNCTFDTVREAVVLDDGVHTSSYPSFKFIDGDEYEVVSPFHKAMLDIYNEDLNLILQKPMSRFIELGPKSKSQTAALLIHIHSLPVRDSPPTEIKDLWPIITTIVLASIYAILTKFLVDHGRPATAQTEVCFHPHMVSSGNFLHWVKTITTFIIKSDTHQPRDSWTELMKDWRNCIFALVNGVWTENEIVVHSGYATGKTVSESKTLGLQRNGVLVVCGALVNPCSGYRNAAIVHHVSVGQVLTLPLKPNGCIESVPRNDTSVPMPMEGRSQVIALQAAKIESRISSNTMLRMDAEPDWENDPTDAIVAVRRGGQHIFSLDPGWAGPSFAWSDVFCTCNKFIRDVSLIGEEKWYRFDLDELLTIGRNVELRPDACWLCDAGSEESCRNLACYITCYSSLDPPRGWRAIDCLQCAYDAAIGFEQRGMVEPRIIVNWFSD